MKKKRILIVNRGEIASRVAKACRELQYTSVGVWTKNEPHAKHLEFCDEWVLLEGEGHQETYLNIEKIVNLAKEHAIVEFIRAMAFCLRMLILQKPWRKKE